MNFPAINNEIEKKKTVWPTESAPLVGVFRGDVHDFKIHWINKKKVNCLGQGCPHCMEGQKSSFQFRVNLIHKNAEGALQASIYEQDWFTYQRLHKANSEYALEDHLVRVYKGKEGAYLVDLIAKIKPIDQTIRDQIQNIQLNDLQDNIADYSKQIKEPESFEDIPF